MSILNLTRKIKRIKKNLAETVVFCMVFMLLAAGYPGIALAGNVGDVVAEVAGRNFKSPSTYSGIEETESGGKYRYNTARGSGGVHIAINEPLEGTDIQTLINLHDFGEGEILVFFMQGYEIKQRAMRRNFPNDTIVWAELPGYLITASIKNTGSGKAADLQKAKSLIQQMVEGLTRSGLVKPAVPDNSQKTVKSSGQSAPAPSTAVTGKPLGESVLVANTMNIGGVYNKPTAPTTFTLNQPHLVTGIVTYHWNNGRGAAPGSIVLRDGNGKVYGPWQAGSRPGQGGVPNAYWEVAPNIVIPAGTYTIIDSDPATWAQNTQSGGRGMAEVKATPHFAVNGGHSGSQSSSGGWTSSPAGVGSVGNIPGPSNTTEAIVGVAVPGLIATGLGALAGLGGGGGGFAPSGGTPLSPTGGGSFPGAGGSYPGAGAGQPGAAQTVSQLGRRRQPEIIIDTADMGQGSITTGNQAPSEYGLIVKTAAEEAALRIQPESGIIIETVAEAGIFIQTEQNAQPPLSGAGVFDTGILIDTSAIEAAGPAADAIGSETKIATDAPVENAAEKGSQTADESAGPDYKNELAETYDESGFDPEGYDRQGFDKAGYDRAGFDKEGFDKEGYNKAGFNAEGYDRAGYNKAGFDKAGFNREGFDQAGFNKEGFNKEGFNKEGFDKAGFNAEGYDRAGYNKAGFDKAGFNREGFDQAGFSKEGFNKEGFDKAGFNAEGYDRAGYNKAGFDKAGFNREGFDQAGFSKEGFNKEGFDKAGFNAEGYDRAGYNKVGFDKAGFNREGFDQTGFNKEGFNKEGFDKAGYNRAGFNAEGYNRAGYNKAGFDKAGFNREGFDQAGFDKAGFNKEGFNKADFDKAGYNKAGFDAKGFDREGFDKAGLDKDGYGRNGFNAQGFDREGYDVNGYNAKGFNRNGYDAKGYNAAGFDKEGFDKAGWDAEGYGRDGLNKEGFDRQGYDKSGYDKEGYDREGYDKQGRQREGYDEYGYDKKGFNKDGFDKDGYDREGFNYEGYNRSGYDPWGYDKRGYGKDGYHWSGYNADGYDRNGRHWSENPYEGDGNPFNVLTSNAQRTFGEGKVTPHGTTEVSEIDWQPKKPPLGDPYPKTVEKYGAKPWTDEIPCPEPEKPSDAKPEDTGVIGPEDPMNTLKQHGQDKDASAAGEKGGSVPAAEPEGADGPAIPGEGVPVPEDTQAPDSGTPGWPQDGEKRILVGKTDGRSIEIEYDGKTGEWVNTETGNSFDPDRFEQWQDDLAEDRRRIAEDIDKMSQRQDAHSQAVDQKMTEWKKLEQMQKAADKYNIGEPGGPGDVDKAIQKLKDDMLAGREFDQEQVDKIRRVIDNRILGKTTADTGDRWEEVPWYKDLDSALKANAETAREVVTGEKADGSISWAGMGARVAIGAATGGASEYVMTVAEAMHRIKGSVDKGESDVRAVVKAIGQLVLEELGGEMIGAAGGKAMQQFAEKFPNFTNKAGDLAEKIGLAVAAGDQIASSKLGLIGKQSAEEALADLAKRMDDIGAGGLRKVLDDKIADAGLKVASADDLTKAFGKQAADGGDGLGKAIGKAAAGGSDDIAGRAGKAAASGSDDMARGAGNSADGPDLPGHKGAGAADEAAGAAGKTVPADKPTRGARAETEVLNDPKAVAKAEASLQKKMDDFAKLPETKKQELIKDQAVYDEYRLQAEEKNWELADKVQRGEELSVDDVLKMKADPAAMRKLKDMQNMDGLGAELGESGAINVQKKFNETLEARVYEPSRTEVVDSLKGKYGEVRVETVRTPGKEYQPWDINTDNDIIALRKVNGPNGPEWVEIPRGEWEDVYFESYARHTGFDPQDAARRFPDENWQNMSPAEQYRKWGELHGESPTDVTHLEAGRDFSGQRTWIRKDGDLPGRPMIEATPEEIARGVETVTIDGRQMRPASGAELVQRGQGTLLDSEQLGMMEKYKIDHYWQKGDIKSQTEAMEQLRKAGSQAQNLEQGYRNMGYKITDMPGNMEKGLAVVNDSSLSPTARAARLAELGYDSPGDFVDKLTSRIGSLRTARK
ncbi:hypothetical protein [Sporomusa ovata]|uniref:Methylcrotonyl-CoA carboxylase carboxyl transferase subunit n=1 Tax=Sporomusa ovata TaxID=2378 RepID=A0A0U1L3L4_9FIRM|nr:hypothetical protein [Sporomusa ovata]CQR74105.1 Methylcrotonyl-CoA carboxylase carboxyl transferase subunit [Sporomusa ovata]